MSTVLRRLNAVPGWRTLWKNLQFGSIETRVNYAIWDRPNYAYGIYRAADLARRLNLRAISVAEFGVAGGNGLIAMERIADAIGKHMGIDIAVYGFDSGEGMPQPEGYKDLPFYWQPSFYKMDVEKLKPRLTRAKLFLGEVGDTIPRLFEQPIAPLGFLSFDLDYYSSTKRAFSVFEGSADTRLPRIYCYFDDITSEIGCYNEFIGELCAIREFNEAHETKKIAHLHGLEWMLPRRESWQLKIYVMHDFAHPQYETYIAGSDEANKCGL
jgi:hypothetical protein